MRVWQAHETAVTAVAFAPGGGTLATAGDGDPVVRVWDTAAAAEVRQFSLFRETPACVTFSPDGRTLAAGWPWSIQLWDVATGAELPVRLILEGTRHFSAQIVFSADGRTLLSAGRRRGGEYTAEVVQALRWDLADGRVLDEDPFQGPTADPLRPPLALDAETVLWMPPDSVSKTAPAVVTDVPTRKPRAVLAVPAPVRAAALAPAGRLLAAAVRGDVLLWAVPAAGEPPPPQPPRWLDINRWVRGTARPPAAFTPVPPARALAGAAERLDAVAFTPDGRRVLAGGAAGTVRVWAVPDLTTAAKAPSPPEPSLAALQWGMGPVAALAIAPDGLTAVAGGGSGRVVVWDVDV